MTDETRPTEGRKPSDSPEPQGRPDFLPAEDSPEQPGRRPEPPLSFGSDWGDPSDRSETNGTPPYASCGGAAPKPDFSPAPDVPRTGSSYAPPGNDGATQTGPRYSGSAFDSPDGGGTRSHEGPSFGSPDGGTRSYETPSSEGSPFERPSFGAPEDGGTRSYEAPSFGSPDGGTRSYESPSFGPPDGGTRSYEAPSFGGRPPYGAAGVAPGGGSPSGPFGGPANGPFGGPGSGPQGGLFGGSPGGAPLPPPPPQQALGMGAGWAPPPTGPHSLAGQRRRPPGTGTLVTIAALIAVAASLLGSVGTYLLTRPSSSGSDPNYSLGPAPTGATNRDPDSVAGVASRVLPSVVSIEAGNSTSTEGASGSGFLIKDGYVVTNNHVVAVAAQGGEIRVMFNNRKTTTARIVGRDPGSDLAVIKPEESFGNPVINLGNSDDVVVGDPVVAIGSPLGLTGTVTTGIVSSLNRPVIAGDETGTSNEEPAYISAIQTDAAINPGNSGGPLVNGKGEVVGVNSAIATLSRSINSQSGSIGLGFAIPVNQTRRVAEDLITTGKAKRPKIGVILDQQYRGQGVRIASEPANGQQPVDADGPAGKAGLKAGDVILEMDGLALQDGTELIALIRSKTPGAKVTIKYQRAGQEHNATLIVTADDEPVPTPTPS
ncbi:trypsin-like peptidase domain-containing protein [Nonomuraea sp. B12E4]|uniref:trypsin-like peptidase domain-containing protein n=1 Tax=Nonomuraea sp. B12E4 TaxID=3153564 RepID=UPI00325F6DFF